MRLSWVTIMTVQPSWVVSSLSTASWSTWRSLIVDEPRNATCNAASDRVDVFALDKVNFKNSLETSASFKNQIQAIYFQRQ